MRDPPKFDPSAAETTHPDDTQWISVNRQSRTEAVTEESLISEAWTELPSPWKSRWFNVRSWQANPEEHNSVMRSSVINITVLESRVLISLGSTITCEACTMAPGQSTEPALGRSTDMK
eukprot:1208874-Rhodomonas_salina.1